MRNAAHNLIKIIAGDCVPNFAISEWMALISLGRQLDLNAQVYHALLRKNSLTTVPSRARVHLESAKIACDTQQNAVRWEIEQLTTLRSSVICLLKGGAYIHQNGIMSAGRFVSDIDILVSKDKVKSVEFELFTLGFVQSGHDDYDDKYYREWMHEIPPLQQIERGTTIDLHHNLLPIISGRHVNYNFLEQDFESTEHANIKVLSTAHQLIHAAVHLFQDSEFSHSLRDLLDIVALYRELNNDDLTERLIFHAEHLNAAKDLAMALYFAETLCNVSIPAEMITWRDNQLSRQRSWSLWRWCYRRIFLYATLSQRTFVDKIAGALVVMRSHVIKMPAKILFKHTVFKIRKSFKEKWEARKQQPNQAN